VTLEAAQAAGLNPRVFDAVIRAVELGIPTDTNRIRDFVASSLNTGNLQIDRAEAGIAVAAGQARLTTAVARVTGADLAVAGGVNLADASLDATLTLTGLPVAGNAIRPAVIVALKGPLAAPPRTVDANMLASWLALRAVEQQSKRLDAMEQARREALQSSAEEPARPAPIAVPENTNSVSPRSAPPAAASATPRAPAVEQAPPLPPPVTVRPLPRPQERSAPRVPPRVESPPTPDARPRAPPNPAARAGAPGRPLDLIGAQN